MPGTDQPLALISEHDTLAAVAALCAETRAADAAKSFQALMRDLYWKQKDLPACLAIARAGVAFCLVRAVDYDRTDPKLAYELRSAAKGLCYDIASFTWNGWDEHGINITSSDLAAGFDAARANLRLARELKKGNLPLSRAHWMLAGHYLSRSDRKSAAEHYHQGERHAALAGNKPEELSNKAFAHLVDVLEKPDDAEAKQRLEAIKAELKNVEDGPMFIDQLNTAHRVFAR